MTTDKVNIHENTSTTIEKRGALDKVGSGVVKGAIAAGITAGVASAAAAVGAMIDADFVETTLEGFTEEIDKISKDLSDLLPGTGDHSATIQAITATSAAVGAAVGVGASSRKWKESIKTQKSITTDDLQR